MRDTDSELDDPGRESKTRSSARADRCAGGCRDRRGTIIVNVAVGKGKRTKPKLAGKIEYHTTYDTPVTHVYYSTINTIAYVIPIPIICH